MPPIVFYLGAIGIVGLLIAYAVMELARPWPSHAKEREEKRRQQKIEKRHAELNALLDEAAAEDAMYQKLNSDEPLIETTDADEESFDTDESIPETADTDELTEEDTNENSFDETDTSDLEEIEEPEELDKAES